MKALVAIVLAALLCGCGMRVPTLFHVPVSQGNIVDAEKVQKLEQGMTPRQVRYLLGTPLINNDFDDHRWDYVFYYRDRDANVMGSHLSLFFEDGKLARIEGDNAYRALVPEEMGGIDLEKLRKAKQAEAAPPAGEQPAPEPAPGPYANPGTAGT